MDWAIAGVLIAVNTTVKVAVGGWMFLQMQGLKTEMRQQHQDMLAIIQGHTHPRKGLQFSTNSRLRLKASGHSVETVCTGTTNSAAANRFGRLPSRRQHQLTK